LDPSSSSFHPTDPDTPLHSPHFLPLPADPPATFPSNLACVQDFNDPNAALDIVGNVRVNATLGAVVSSSNAELDDASIASPLGPESCVAVYRESHEYAPFESIPPVSSSLISVNMPSAATGTALPLESTSLAFTENATTMDPELLASHFISPIEPDTQTIAARNRTLASQQDSTALLNKRSTLRGPSIPAKKDASRLRPDPVTALSDEFGEIHEKPKLSYAQLICRAIRDSHEGKMTLANIYAWIMDTFPFFRLSDSGWQVLGIS
jgi:hypothetical protein